jgi:hypothetical protein
MQAHDPEVRLMRTRLLSAGPAARAALALIAAAALLGAAQPAAIAATAAPTPAIIKGPPQVGLVIAQKKITVPVFGKNDTFLDPGIFVASFRSPLIFHVQRAGIGKPITISQVLHLPGNVTRTVAWPSSTLNGFDGLSRFATLQIRNSAGKVVVTRQLTFCPNGFAQPTNAGSRASSPYPQECSAFDPFQLSMVWGIARGWAAEPGDGGIAAHLTAGHTYKITETVAQIYTKLLHISAASATATVTAKAVKAGVGVFPATPASVHRSTRTGSARDTARHGALPVLRSNVPTLRHPPAAALPDLVPLPSFGISTSHLRASKGTPARNLLDFDATVSVAGHAQLDVEGFRDNGSTTMKAYQYFWRHGHIIGRARAGTMGFEGADNAWHFQQFARYELLNAGKQDVVASHKEGFCIAPTDPISLLLPGAVWQPGFTGLIGACGVQSALAVQEQLPLGWADTYGQFSPGESFDITNVPNGTYYIEIAANPLGVLHETSTANDISLRKIILGGTTAHRTVRVPAVDGIDPEH